jgi:hypothetical protein
MAGSSAMAASSVAAGWHAVNTEAAMIKAVKTTYSETFLNIFIPPYRMIISFGLFSKLSRFYPFSLIHLLKNISIMPMKKLTHRISNRFSITGLII